MQRDLIEMFKIMKGIDKLSAEEFFSEIDSDRTMSHSVRVKKRRVRMVVIVRHGSFTPGVVNAWEGLPWKGSGSRNKGSSWKGSGSRNSG